MHVVGFTGETFAPLLIKGPAGCKVSEGSRKPLDVLGSPDNLSGPQQGISCLKTSFPEQLCHFVNRSSVLVSSHFKFSLANPLNLFDPLLTCLKRGRVADFAAVPYSC